MQRGLRGRDDRQLHPCVQAGFHVVPGRPRVQERRVSVLDERRVRRRGGRGVARLELQCELSGERGELEVEGGDDQQLRNRLIIFDEDVSFVFIQEGSEKTVSEMMEIIHFLLGFKLIFGDFLFQAWIFSVLCNFCEY